MTTHVTDALNGAYPELAPRAPEWRRNAMHWSARLADKRAADQDTPVTGAGETEDHDD